MDKFIEKHQDKIVGVLSCFDRMIIKGYLPFRTGPAVEQFLYNRVGILLKSFRSYMKKMTMELREHAEKIAAQHNRPIEFINTEFRKDDYVRKIAERDNIKEGLICILRVLEEGPSYQFRYGEGRPYLSPCRPRCMTIYYYFIDPEFGLMHIRLQAWLPLTIQFYLNGHEWLAKQLNKKGIKYKKVENAFLSIDNFSYAQRIADKFCRIGWIKKLNGLSRRVNPYFSTILKGMEYYWVLDQVEYSTDIIFTDRPALESLYQNMQKHAAVCIQAEDLLKLLGKKLDGRFRGEVGNIFKNRLPFTRVKHQVNGNWIKMYDKFGSVLRVETVINRPYWFKVRRRCLRKGKEIIDWCPMAKCISNMYRYQDIGLMANKRYVSMMAGVIDPQESFLKLNKLCEPVFVGKYRYRGFNPLKRSDLDLFRAVNRGDYSINGFKSSDMALHLGITLSKDITERRRQSARLNRIIRIFHSHGLIAKVQNTKRYRLTVYGTEMMSSALYLYREKYPEILNKAA